MTIYVRSSGPAGQGNSLSPYNLTQFRSFYPSGTSEDVKITTSTITAASLNEINGLTSGTVDASNVSTITGAIADVITTYTSGGISGLGDEKVTLLAGIVFAAELNSLNGYTSGAINASLVTYITGNIASVITAYTAGGISGLGTIGVVLLDEAVTVANLNSLDAYTRGTILADSVLTITGAIADLLTTYASSSGISGLGNEAVTLSDTTASAENLNSLDTSISGAIDASTVTTITGTIADLLTTYTSGGISGLGNEAVTLSDLTVSATDLLNLITKTSGSVDVSYLTSVTGTASERSAVVDASSRFTGFSSSIVCFLAGTLIATPSGERSIESLEIGDEVATRSGDRQIKFISRSSRNIFQLMELGKLPICIQAGALGDVGPTQDLWISPSHAVLLSGHLVEASALLNWSTVTQPQDPGCFQVTYYNIEFENHEIIRANGIEVESYYANWRGDGYSRADWDNYDEYLALYGESNGMEELPMPRIPFARQLPAELRLILQLNESNQNPALAH